MGIRIVIINSNRVVTGYTSPSLNAWDNGRSVTYCCIFFYTTDKLTADNTFVYKFLALGNLSFSRPLSNTS